MRIYLFLIFIHFVRILIYKTMMHGAHDIEVYFDFIVPGINALNTICCFDEQNRD